MCCIGVKFRLVDEESLMIAQLEFKSWIWNYLKPKEGDIFVDVRAHIGKYSCIVAKLVMVKGAVYAFEPHSLNFKRLEENV